jgi:hypothetical protein
VILNRKPRDFQHRSAGPTDRLAGAPGAAAPRPCVAGCGHSQPARRSSQYSTPQMPAVTLIIVG